MTVETQPKRLTKLAHHVAWFLEFRVWPKMLLHSCDTPACVEVTHLSEGDHRRNQQEAMERGQYPLRERRYNARLTEADVFDMRWLRGIGARNVDIAAAYGVAQSTACQVTRNKRWMTWLECR